MKAKCPYCESGCEKCANGYTEAFLASGTMWTRHCNTCGEDNGGRIEQGDEPPKHNMLAPMDCIWCKSTDVIWLKIGDTEEMGLTEL